MDQWTCEDHLLAWLSGACGLGELSVLFTTDCSSSRGGPENIKVLLSFFPSLLPSLARCLNSLRAAFTASALLSSPRGLHANEATKHAHRCLLFTTSCASSLAWWHRRSCQCGSRVGGNAQRDVACAQRGARAFHASVRQKLIRRWKLRSSGAPLPSGWSLIPGIDAADQSV